MTVTIDQAKRACSGWACMVRVDKRREAGRCIYCSDSADHQTSGAGCQHVGCACHG
jgi:metallothionein